MEIKEACLKYTGDKNDIKIGQVILFNSGKLRCHYLIHSVGRYFTKFLLSVFLFTKKVLTVSGTIPKSLSQ